MDTTRKCDAHAAEAFRGQDLLYVTTVAAKTGQKRQTAVARFPDGEDAWLVVASAAGSAHHPADRAIPVLRLSRAD